MEDKLLQEKLLLKKELQKKLEILDKEFGTLVELETESEEHTSLKTFKKKATELSDCRVELNVISLEISTEIDKRRLESFRKTIANNGSGN